MSSLGAPAFILEQTGKLCVDEAGVPIPVLAVIEALRFRDPSLDRLQSLNAKQWAWLLPWCEARQLTVMLSHFGGDALPPEARRHVESRRVDFEMRLDRIKRQIADIADALAARNLPFVVLKGFTHAPALTPDPVWRTQGDIDLWCPPEQAAAALPPP